MGILQQALMICMAISGMMVGLVVVFALIIMFLYFLKQGVDEGVLPDMFSKPEINGSCSCESPPDINSRSQAIYYALMGVLHEFGLDELLREFDDARRDEEVVLDDAVPAAKASTDDSTG